MKILIAFCIAVSTLLFAACNNTPTDNAAKLTSDETNSQNFFANSKKQTLLAHDMTIDYIYEANTIILNFPQQEPAPTGKVSFFSPSKTENNRIFNLKTDPSKRMLIQVDGFEKGVWRIKVEWQGEDKIYVKEQNIHIEPNEWARPIHK